MVTSALSLERSDTGAEAAAGAVAATQVPNDQVSAVVGDEDGLHSDALLGILERLDEASLEQQRALSIPFVKQVLGW